MMPGNWEKVKEIFSGALNVPSMEREAYVRAACEGDADVLRQVNELLRADVDAAKSFLEPRTIVFVAPWLFVEGDLVANRFRVLKPIARGAMGEVYQVYDERLRLDVALKAIRPELIGDGDTFERFRREVLVTRDISHEGLCKVFDLVEHEWTSGSTLPAGTVIPCLTLQLLEGTSLNERLQSGGPLTPAEATPLVEQIAEALQVLHDAGVVHRDLKPSNVMLVPGADGTRAVLTDFGLAKPLDASIFETQEHVLGGSPYFMAPELLKGHRPSRASDIYAFGLLIDEMVTSARAFDSDSLHTLMLQKLGDGPSRPAKRAANLPRSWEGAILRCLAPNPKHRFATPRQVVAALAAPARWAPWQRVFPPHASATKPRRRRIAGYTATMAIVLAGSALLDSPAHGTAQRSVVIGDFQNLTSRGELAYLAAGTTGELTRRLSRVPQLRVYRKSDSSTPIDRSDGPTFSLHGDIQEVGAMLRITVAVTDVRGGNVLWSQKFEGPAERALQLEDQLAADTVAALVRLYPEGEDGPMNRASAFLTRMFSSGRAQLPTSGTTNPTAFDAYLRGRVLFEERTVPSALQSIQHLKRAIDLDPRFAAAYATLADVHGVLMDLHYAPHNQLIAEAEKYADQAVALDPDLPEAQLTLAAVRQMQWRWEESDAAYRRAIDLHPTFARAHRWYGGLLLQFGRFDESLALYRRGLELDPYDYPSQSAYGHALFHAGRAREAAAHLEKLITQKDLLYAHNILGQAYAYLAGGTAPDRDAFFRKALQESEILRAKESAGLGSPGVTEYGDMVGALAWIYHGEPEGAGLHVARLEDGLARGRVSPSMLARVYAAQGDTQRAIDALLDAEKQTDRELFYIGVSPYYARIRSEPQFRALMQRLRLSPN